MLVNSVKFEAIGKTYRLANQRVLRAHRYCCLGPGDDVVITRAGHAYAKCRNGNSQILPIYKARDSLAMGTKLLRLTIKEIETDEELEAYHQLEEFHYRGKALHGRRVPLIIRSEDPMLPRVLGYIELSSAFIMNRPRAVLFDAKFKDSHANVAWTTWRKSTVRQYTNLVVRIARTVVSPEFRGLGLARILVKHAARFSKRHWHVGKLKPLFLEITADMLRYVPFVETAGMHYIGDTEGNLARVNEDMKYILKNYSRVSRREILKEKSGGIVDLQVLYATRLKHIERAKKIPRERLLGLLLHSPQRLSDEDWGLLHRVLRLPKPTFLMGLSPAAEAFVRRRVQELGLPNRYPVEGPAKRFTSLTAPIVIRNCTLDLSATLVKTRATRKVQQAFGVSRDMLTARMFAGLNLEIRPGEIVLICGPSGAGKTTLLSLISNILVDPTCRPDGLIGSIEVPREVMVRTLTTLPSSRPLINSLGRVSFDHALFALNVSGLAEAHLYVKRFRQLSNGQRYRAMVAKLIASEADVWIADEFCATLDPITANVVSRNLHRCAGQLGVTVILAAANWAGFIHELRPDKIVHLRSPWDHAVFTWKEFERAIGRSATLSHELVSHSDWRRPERDHRGNNY